MSFPPPRPRLTPAVDTEGRFVEVWAGWFRSVWNVLNPGISGSIIGAGGTATVSNGVVTKLTTATSFSGTVALAKLTVSGTNGSLTVVNGLITGYTAPT